MQLTPTVKSRILSSSMVIDKNYIAELLDNFDFPDHDTNVAIALDVWLDHILRYEQSHFEDAMFNAGLRRKDA